MANPNPIKYSDLIQPDNSIQDLISQLEEAIKVYGEMKATIQQDAAALVKSMQSVSGATDEQRQEITRLAKETDNLSNQYREISTKEADATAKLKMANEANREAVKISQLKLQVDKSAEGSYIKLSAQYRLLKIRINEMGEADKKAVEAKRALEVQARKLFERMSELQKATGKYTLEVGHYENALKALPGGIGSVISSFQMMRGQLNQLHGSELPAMQKGMSGALTVFTGVVGIVSILGRTMGSARNVVRDFEQANANLSTILGVNIDEMKSLSDTARQLGRDTQWTASQVVELQTELAKLGFEQSQIKDMQGAVLNFATAVGANLSEAASVAGSTLRAFGLQSDQTEEVLSALAVATNKSALSFDRIKQSIGTVFPVARAYGLTVEDTTSLLGTLANAGFDASTAATALRNILLNLADSNGKLAKSLGGSVNTLDGIIDGMIELRERGIDVAGALELTDKRSVSAFSAFLDGAEKARELRSSLEGVSGALEEIAEQRLATTEGAIKQLNSAWDNLMLSFDQGNTILGSLTRAATDFVRAITPKTELDKAERDVERLFKKYNGDIDKVRENLDKTFQGLQFQLVNISEGDSVFKRIWGKDSAQEQAQMVKAVEDRMNALVDAANAALKARQSQYSWSITPSGVQWVSGQGPLAQPLSGETTTTTTTGDANGGGKTKAQSWSLQNDKEFQKQRLALLKQFQDGEIATREEYDKQISELEIATLRKRLETARLSATERTSLETQTIEKEIALREKADKAEAKRRADAIKAEQDAWMAQLKKEEETINLEIAATEDGSKRREELRINLLYKQWEIEIAANSAKTEEMRQDEALINAKWDKAIKEQRVKAGLDTATAVTEEAAKAAEKTKKRTGGDLIDLIFGTKEGEEGEKLEGIKDALRTTINAVMESVSSLISSWEQAGDAAVAAAEKQVESAQKVLDAEREAHAQGYANNVRRAEQELALAKKTQAKAQKQKEDAQKAQLAIDSITQASSLVTASAEIWQSLGGIPIVGPALAAAAITLMFGTFLAAKIKAAQVSKETYGEGHVEMLEGGSHASGHDISLGRKADGTERRAEGGEFFAVINKRNSRRYRNVIPDVINAFNDGTFAEKYQRANESLAGYAVNLIGADLSHLEKGVDTIAKQGEERRMIEGGYVVVRYKNLTRRYKS